MALGALAAGIRVGRRLGDDVVAMTHLEGFKANLTTAMLVRVGRHPWAANVHDPRLDRSNRRHRRQAAVPSEPVRLRDFLLAWTLTPAAAGGIAIGAYSLLR